MGQNSGQDPDVFDRSEDLHNHFDGYDVLDVPLGDLMRGERATMGKSLLDVERELKIRAAFIAAIENGDVGAFSSPGFIAGYIRSYARYLKIDPEWAYGRFCEETGFQGVHGFSAQQAEAAKRSFAEAPKLLDPNDVLSSARVRFSPGRESVFSGVEPGQLGSIAVLLALVVGLGYGAWAVLHDIQRLQIAPVDEAPVPLAQLDPLSGAGSGGAFEVTQDFDITMPGPEGLDRLYRPQPLETPRLTPRDSALAALDPDRVGALASDPAPERDTAAALAAPAQQVASGEPAVQVTEPRASDEVVLFALRPTWVRISSASGATLEEVTLNRGDTYAVVADAGEAPRLRTGNAGSLYAGVNGVVFGPFGDGAVVVSEVELSADNLTAAYTIADVSADSDLREVAGEILDLDVPPSQ